MGTPDVQRFKRRPGVSGQRDGEFGGVVGGEEFKDDGVEGEEAESERGETCEVAQ